MGNCVSWSEPSPEKLSKARTKADTEVGSTNEKETHAFVGANEAGRTPLPLPWERNLQGFKFLRLESVCSGEDIGVFDYENWFLTASNAGILATTETAVILYDTIRHTIREFPHPTNLHHKDIFHSLSPDGRTMIRWTWKDKDAAGDYCVVEAIRTDTNIVLGQLRGTNMYLRHDSANVVWVNNTVVYLPASGKGSVIRWSLEQNNVSKSVIRPMSPITKHEILKIHVAKDERWWIANGQTFDDQRTSANGLIQVHNVDKNESKQLQGTVCCIGEAVVSDFRKTLLFISDANNGRLSLRIQQLDMDAPGESFQPVDISVKMLLTEDCPWMLVPLEGLPIVVVVTTNCVLYFFEIYTGGYLFSQNLDGDKWSVFGDSDDLRSLLLYRRSQKSIYRVSVNTDDLIGYIRRVLQDDALAASVAIRTDYHGTDSVMINDMHTPYDDTTNESND